MNLKDTTQPNILQFDPDRHKFDDPNLEQLFKDIGSGIKELKRKNKALEDKNAELVSLLDEANEKIARLEQPLARNPEWTRDVFRVLAHILDRAGDGAQQERNLAKAENADRYEEAIRVALGLQREAMSLLENAREQAALRNRESEQKASTMIEEVGKSMLALAEDLDGPMKEATLPQLGQPPADKIDESPLGVEAEGAVGAADEAPPHEIVERHSLTTGIALPSAENVTDGQTESEGEISAFRATADEDRPTATRRFEEPVEHFPLTEFVELVASPFHSFATLSAFHRAVQAVPGVVTVEAKGFDRGTLRLVIEYSGSPPLAGQLAELRHFNLRFVSVGENKIEVLLEKGNSTGGLKTSE